MEKIVTNCEDCPFYYYDTDYGSHECTQQTGRDGIDVEDGEDIHSHRAKLIHPDWCPLLKEEITVKFIKA